MLRQLVICLLIAVCVSGHMRMLDPAARSSLWRFPEFSEYHPLVNHLDDEIWCGRVKQFGNDTRCGICGDPVTDPTPRANEHGGTFGRGIISRNYKSGQDIHIHLQSFAVVVAHGGAIEIQLCDTVPETEDCFKKLTLGNDMPYWPVSLDTPNVEIHTTARLPAGVTCEHCVIRMHYRGAEHYGPCDDSFTCTCGTDSGVRINDGVGLGCSEQYTFRTCADIKIL